LAPPALRPGTMPAPPPLLAALGPGIVWLALAQGSGELVWWPLLVAKYGLGLVFLLVPACLLQWPLNVEIGRYTVLTGESIWQGFVRQSRGFAFGLWLLMAASFLWFGGFASAGGEAVATLTGAPAALSPEARKVFWGALTVVVSATALLTSRRSYRLIERVMTAVAVVTVVGLLVSCLHPKVLAALPEFASGLVRPRWPEGRAWDPADSTRLLTGVSFAGLGGFWTLFYSSWLREKGAGMAAELERRSSAVTGRGEFLGDGGFTPVDDPALAPRVRAWTRLLWADAGVGVVGNIATTLMTCLLSYALLFPAGKVPSDHELVSLQAEFFAASFGDLGRAIFLLVAAAFLADTWLGTVDAVSHTHTEMLRSLAPRVAAKWSYRKLYTGWVLVLTAVSLGTMASRSPAFLILTSAVLGFVGTVLYSGALLHLNYRVLPRLVPAAAAPPRRGAFVLAGIVATYACLAGLYAIALLRAP